MARARWAKAKKNIAHSRLLFVDESGAKTNMTRRYGRASRGARAYDRVPSGRWETTTMIAAVGRNGPQAPWVLEGPMDGSAFAAWAEQVLAPTLVPGDIVVLDNLSVHRNAQAIQAIEAMGASVWYLPPYSPDLNPHRKNVEQNKGSSQKRESERCKHPVPCNRKSIRFRLKCRHWQLVCFLRV